MRLGFVAPNLGDPIVVEPFKIPAWYSLLSTASAAVSGYHGYKRNDSIGWGIGWFLLGGLFPILVPTIGFAQGFGKRKAK